MISPTAAVALSSLLLAVWGICLGLILAILGSCHLSTDRWVFLSCYKNRNGIFAENMPYIL